MRVPGAGDEGGRPGRGRRSAQGTLAGALPTPPACWWPSPAWARRCWRRARRARRPAGGSSSSRRCSSPPWPGCCSPSGSTCPASIEVGTGLVRHRAGPGRARRATRQLLHRAAGRAGGDAVHRAVHGRRHRRRPGRAAGGDDAGVPGDGAWPRGALCRAGGDAGLWRAAPRPGRWMEVLRQALAFPMYGASAWLVWVVSEEAGPSGVLGTAAGLVLLGFAGWVLGITQAQRRPRPAHRPVGRRRRAAGGAGGAERHRGGTGRAVRCGGSRGRSRSVPLAWPRCAPRGGRCSST